MTHSLTVYLQDHLAGAKFAIALLGDLSKNASDSEVARFCAVLLEEVEADRATLHQLVLRLGEDTSALKEVAAWVVQKATRAKLTVSEPMGTFEAIETLSLGVQGKLALWNALETIRERDHRINGLDLDELKSRACKQFAQLEVVRLRLAESILAPKLVQNPVPNFHASNASP